MFDWDKRGLFSSNIGDDGIRTSAFAADMKTAVRKLEILRANRGADASFIGVLDLDTANQVKIVASALDFPVKTMVVLGIGGSYAGAAAAIHALKPELLDPPDTDIVFVPYIDPETLAPLVERIDPATTLVNCISKSGRTTETMAQYALFRDKFQNALGDAWKRHFVFTTDPEKGFLRHTARETGVRTLEIPSGLGGRFSVLSPVGLFPMYMAGIDIDAVVRGAREYMARDTPEAVRSAVAHHLLMQQGKSIRVFMVYNDSLQDLGKWFVQLWAESLGKQRHGNRLGQTPVLFRGSVDQHSMLQLFMDGPRDKVYTMLRVEQPRGDAQLPTAFLDDPEVNDLHGQSLSKVFSALSTATAAALIKTGNPLEILDIYTIDPTVIGALFAHFELETAITGLLMGVNPFDQPGVEMGKIFAHALMGRADLKDKANELADFMAGLTDPKEA